MPRKTEAAKAKNVAYTREWDKANPEQRREIKARHRAKVKAAKGLCLYPWCRELAADCRKHGSKRPRLAVLINECHEGVTVNGEFQPCEKPAVAARLDEEGIAYPVCSEHKRPTLLPLAAGGLRVEYDTTPAPVRRPDTEAAEGEK